MKHYFAALLLVLFMLPAVLTAENAPDYNSEQLALRTDIFNFLKEEGFVPEIDSDGDVKFKSEGQAYYFRVSATDDDPMYVVLFRQFNNPEDFSAETIVMATKQLNLYKGIKVLCFDESFRIGAELFVRNAEPVKAVFYKLIGLIESVQSDFMDACREVGSISSSSQSISEIPFIITKMEVANVDLEGNIIQGYGETIWDFKTKYLKPRITIKPFRSSGSYTLYVKMYKDGALTTGSSSPKGYSYSEQVTISGSSSQVLYLSGWGADTSGKWSMGEYRFEIWYNGYCIGSTTFNVK